MEQSETPILVVDKALALWVQQMRPQPNGGQHYDQRNYQPSWITSRKVVKAVQQADEKKSWPWYKQLSHFFRSGCDLRDL